MFLMKNLRQVGSKLKGTIISLVVAGIAAYSLNCTKGPSVLEGIPTGVQKVFDNYIAIEIYVPLESEKLDSQKVVAITQWTYSNSDIENTVEKIQNEIDDGDNETIELIVVKQGEEDNYTAKPKRVGHNIYK